jgi:hypothetical protein
MSELVSRFMSNFEAQFGYPPGENAVFEVTSGQGGDPVHALAAAKAPSALIEFYAKVDKVSLPDVGNGLFVHTAEAVADGLKGEQPTEMVGSFHDSIVVFGSDGGGCLFALNSLGDKVYRLGGGSLVGSVYDVDEPNASVIATGFQEFLDYLRRELSDAVAVT